MHSHNMYGSLAYLILGKARCSGYYSFFPIFFNGLYSLSNAVNFPEWENGLNPRVLHKARLLSRKLHNFLLQHSLAFFGIH